MCAQQIYLVQIKGDQTLPFGFRQYRMQGGIFFVCFMIESKFIEIHTWYSST